MPQLKATTEADLVFCDVTIFTEKDVSEPHQVKVEPLTIEFAVKRYIHSELGWRIIFLRRRLFVRPTVRLDVRKSRCPSVTNLLGLYHKDNYRFEHELQGCIDLIEELLPFVTFHT